MVQGQNSPTHGPIELNSLYGLRESTLFFPLDFLSVNTAWLIFQLSIIELAFLPLKHLPNHKVMEEKYMLHVLRK